jgi:hypothetical protein
MFANGFIVLAAAFLFIINTAPSVNYESKKIYKLLNQVMVYSKVATGSSSFGFGLGLVSNFEKYLDMVWLWFVPTEPENHISKFLQLFSKFFFKFSKKYENSV